MTITKTFLGKIGLAALIMGMFVSSASAATTLTAEDFGVMNQSGVKGYTAGFKLGEAGFGDVEKITVRLYSGDRLLQTNTSTEKIETLTGSQFSSPFDVFGNFNYEDDGYWMNKRQKEYGQNLIPTKVVATVELENGTIMATANTNLTGDPDSIFPEPNTQKPSSKNQCKKGGWMSFLLGFKNQGRCISFFNHNR